MLSRKLLVSGVTVAGLAAAAGLAVAQQAPFSSQNDAVAIAEAFRIGLSQAVNAAEQHVGGRAAQAQIERRDGAFVAEVEVVTPARAVIEVTVDADGRVLAARADGTDDGAVEREEDD